MNPKRPEWTAAEIAVLAALRDRNAPYSEIAKQLGRTLEACCTKARSLRRKNPVGALVKAEPKVTVERSCMCCRQTFPSEGKHNRLCGNCRHKRNDDFSIHGSGTVYA